MNFSSIGGALVSIAVLVWVALIIPSWIQSKQHTNEVREVRKAQSQLVRNLKRTSGTVVVDAQAIIFAKANRNFTVSRVVMLFSFIFGLFAASQFWFLAASGSALFFLASILISNRLLKKRNDLLAEFGNRRNKAKPAKSFAKYLSESMPNASASQQGWTPVEVPVPMHLLNRNGLLEQPKLAHVRNLEQVQTKPNSAAELDEILRRRRAN